MTRIAIVSSYPALRAGLRALLAAEGLEILAEASEPGDLLAARALDELDVAVLDLPLGGVDSLLELLPEWPSLRPLVLGPVEGADRLTTALDARPWAYLPREAGPEQLAAAARAVAAGLVTIDPTLAPALLAQPAAARQTVPEDAAEELTAREREVLTLMAEGLANKQIAARLGISEHTVKFHVAAILAKLGAASRTEAGYVAARRGLIAL
jgi:DNA-binding NarL/FixJ family response regulator